MSCFFQDSLLVLNIWHFNHNVSWCKSLWVHHLCNSLFFRDLDVRFFPTLGKFPAIISSIKFSASFSHSSSWTLIMWMLICLFSHKSLKLYSRFSFFFSFCCCDCVSSTALSQVHWCVLLLHLVYCWIFFYTFILFYLFLAALGLCCCAWAFSSCRE